MREQKALHQYPSSVICLSIKDGTYDRNRFNEPVIATAEQLSRDLLSPRTVVNYFQLPAALMVVLCLFVLSAAGKAWQYWRRPDLIVVDRSNGRVLVINDRGFGKRRP
ncbi:MAG: hypothetical protein J2P21_18360 [Chloracidobacterium sp.]|nr:hypothetical protein [Chloracidobacterium sp.]